MPKPASVSRRTFLERSATTAAVTLVSRHVLGGPRYVPPSDRINVAYVGCGTQGLRQLMPALQSPDLRIVAVCDPNRKSEDYVEWYRNELRDTVRDLPLRPDLGRGGAGLPLRARGRPRARGPALRRGAGRGLPRLRRLPGDAGEGEGPRRRLHHDARPPPRHGRARGHEGREARDRPQAARQRPPRGAARDPDRARDGRRHPHVLRGRAAVDAAAHRVDPGRRDRPGARGAQLVHAALLAAGHDDPARREAVPVPEGLDWDLWLGPVPHRPYHPAYTNAVFRGLVRLRHRRPRRHGALLASSRSSRS